MSAPGVARRGVIYLAAAVVLTAGAFMLLAHNQAQRDAEAFQARRAMSIARSIAWVATQENLREDDAAEDLTKRYVTALTEKVQGVNEALVLRKTKFLAHSNPEKAGKRLDRESLADKALFDAARALKSNVRKNIEEREKRPELTENPYPEVKFVVEGDTFSAELPVKDEGKFRAMARITTRAVPVSTGLPWLALALALGVAVIFFFGGRKVDGVGHLALGVLVIGGFIVALMFQVAGWRDDLRRQHAGEIASVYGQMAEAGLLEAAAPDQLKTLAPELSLTPEGTQPGDLVGIHKVGAGEAPAHATAFTAAGHEIFYANAWFESSRSRDLTGLRGWGIGYGVMAIIIFLLGAIGRLGRAGRAVFEKRHAYYYLSPAAVGMVLLVFIPVTFGILLGFQELRYGQYEFVGLANYVEILSDFNVSEPRNFYFKLGVTFLWTGLNVFLHVSIGLFLALLLNDQMLKAKGVYRVILVLPWAIPSYITALIWKLMFHKQFGAINGFLEGLNIEAISWFQDFWPAFATNVITNTWLGFPFMMVVSLGALQSIPSDLYEAARVDGANRWQRFRSITLPLLMPALVPAVIVGTVWTFNMFNVIYLVSGGAPNGATDILITDAFRWAFEQRKWGFAAAYSTLIFIVLLCFTLVTNRITGATKGAYE